MGEWTLDLLKQLGGFTILAQTLVHMSASQKFEPYVRLLVATMTILILMAPILDFIVTKDSGVTSSFRQQVEQIMEADWYGEVDGELFLELDDEIFIGSEELSLGEEVEIKDQEQEMVIKVDQIEIIIQ